MYWQIREDLLSLFRRGNNNENHFDPIDGLRSIANILIILLHLVSIFSALILPYPDKEWKDFILSIAFGLNNIMSFGLEIFLMISSFLLTYQLINQWNIISPNLKIYLLKEYPLSIIKRALRFWPGILLTTLILILFGEPSYPSSGYLFQLFRHLNHWLFFQNYYNLEYWYVTFAPLWSISLDMQMHLILPLFLYLFNCLNKYISIWNCLLILLLISIIRGIIVFNPLTMPISSIAYRYPSFQVLSPDYLIDWMEMKYNLTFSSDLSKVNRLRLYMHEMYLPFEGRFGSYIIGSMLAIQLIENNKSENKCFRFKKYLYFGLICFYLLSLIPIPDPDIPPPSDIVMKIGIACSRQLFTLSLSFVLFSALCPSNHPYYSPWIKKCLCLSIWIPISKLSYFVYLIHWRISFELIFGGPLKYLQRYSVTSAVFICLPIILLLTQIISCIWYVLAEKPIERAIHFYFFHKKPFKNRIR